VVGLNGAGKSTLLKGIAGTLAPKAGEIKVGAGVEMAFFAQHVIEDLNPGDTVLRSLERVAHRDVLPQDLKDLAGSLLFSGDDVKKPVSILSGGEKSRVALGRVLLKKAPCLILDEPTNHLDFQTVEALTCALNAYEGTVIVVSHDRGFIRRVGTKILEVDHGKVRLYPGSYDEYVWNLEKTMEREGQGTKATPGPARETAVQTSGPNAYELKKERERRLRSCEKKLAALESEMASLHSEIAAINDALSTAEHPDPKSIEAMSEKGRRLNAIESEWMDVSSEKERLETGS
jgi:ATP-binding cassette subfamily F protein 3